MTTFEYKGFDASGQTQKGLIEALDLKHAREKLAASGIMAEWIAPAGAGANRRLFRAQHFSLEMRTDFYHELVALLRAGLPLVAALDVLIQSPEMGRSRPLLAGVRDKIREGASLADALAGACGQISSYEKAIIVAGERAAALDLVLERLADFLEEQHRLRERILTALIYPAILFVVAIVMAVGLLGFAVPHIGQLLTEQTRISIPLLTRIMIKLGHIVALWGIPVMLMVILGVAYAWRRMKGDPARALAANRRLLGLPVIGRGYAILINLRFARTLSLLLRGGVPLIDSLIMAGEATGSAWVSHRVAREADAVRHGASLADALRRIPPFASSLASWIQVGEAGGSLDRMLDNAGKRFQQQWDRYLTRRLAFLEPGLIILIGVFVLLVVLSILLPIISLNKSLI